MEAHTAATACASGPIALSGTERLRVASMLVCSALELLSAVSAGNEDPSPRHPHRGVVVADMTGDRHERKVLKAVVSLVAVEVVDLLPSSEAAAKMLAHDEAMLKDVEASACDLDVPVGSLASNRLATRADTHPDPSGAPSVSHISAASAWWISPVDCTTTLNGF